MGTKSGMLITAPQPLWSDIETCLGDRWEAIPVPMATVECKDDRNFSRLAQQLMDGYFSVAVFVNLLSARFTLQGPKNVVRAAASGLRNILVISQAPEVARELSALGIKSVVPRKSCIYDILDDNVHYLDGKNLMLFSGDPPGPHYRNFIEKTGCSCKAVDNIYFNQAFWPRTRRSS